MFTHLCKIDWNTTNLSSSETWSMWKRKLNGAQQRPLWVEERFALVNFCRWGSWFSSSKIMYLRFIVITNHLFSMSLTSYNITHYFLAPWGSLRTNLSSHGNLGSHFLTKNWFHQTSFNLYIHIVNFLSINN